SWRGLLRIRLEFAPERESRVGFIDLVVVIPSGILREGGLGLPERSPDLGFGENHVVPPPNRARCKVGAASSPGPPRPIVTSTPAGSRRDKARSCRGRPGRGRRPCRCPRR